MTSSPWRNNETLERLYWDEGLSQTDIAEKLGCNASTVCEWMGRHNIEKRDRGEATAQALEGRNPWDNKEILEHLYWEEGMSSREIAERFDCYHSTVLRSMRRHDIERELPHSERPPHFLTRRDGYEVVRDGGGGEVDIVYIHRLLATLLVDDISELEGMDAHHKNWIPWDNRLENIELLTPSEHGKHHHGGGEWCL